jgi:hypothetical protein
VRDLHDHKDIWDSPKRIQLLPEGQADEFDLIGSLTDGEFRLDSDDCCSLA